MESILRQLQSENVDENVVDSVQYRLDWIFNTVARYADLQIVELTAVTPDDVVGTFWISTFEQACDSLWEITFGLTTCAEETSFDPQYSLINLVAYCNKETARCWPKLPSAITISRVFFPLNRKSNFGFWVPCWGRLYKTLNHFFNHYFVVK